MRTHLVMIAEEVFRWAFLLALLLAVVDWVRPFTVSPVFNVAWLEIIALGALASVVVFGNERAKAP